MTASCVYEGTVRHRRHEPVRHELCHRIALMYLDLDELPALFDGHPLWSARRPALAWLRRSDFLGPHDVPLDVAVRDLVFERTGERPEGPVRMLAHLRYLGHSFNPVTFYYVFAGSRLRWVVAEVTNTPWGERHAYVLDPAADDGTPKAFHVSPFMGMDHEYRWRVLDPGAKLILHIDSLREGRRAFDATLTLRRLPFSRGSLRRVLWRYPLATLAVSARIYGHALRLKLKGAPYFAHPGGRAESSAR